MFTQLMKAIFSRGYATPLERMAQELGWQPLATGRLWSHFRLPFDGQSYDLWIEQRGSLVTFTLMSNALFAQKLYPPVLKEVLQHRNEELDPFTWQLFNGQRATWAKLCGSLTMNECDPEVTRELVREMLSEVHCYDSGLRAKGLM